MASHAALGRPVMWLAAFGVVVASVVLLVAWGNRHPGRHAHYHGEGGLRRLRDWWAFVRARR